MANKVPNRGFTCDRFLKTFAFCGGNFRHLKKKKKVLSIELKTVYHPFRNQYYLVHVGFHIFRNVKYKINKYFFCKFNIKYVKTSVFNYMTTHFV